ncbi:MAG TPA: hypothetical protein VGQ48_01030 [Gemmatimonadales bacterium]|jgi:hypothetical protein|nr:hypothetical protein [Gemmatimonadales bacterium]
MESLTQRQRLEQAHHALLHVHRALLEAERIRYERQHGRVDGSGALLQLVLNDPWFYWLRPISALIVQIDDWLDADPPAPDASNAAELLLAQVRDRLRPDAEGADFQQRYYRLLQEEPTVAVAHAEVRKLINA